MREGTKERRLFKQLPDAKAFVFLLGMALLLAVWAWLAYFRQLIASRLLGSVATLVIGAVVVAALSFSVARGLQRSRGMNPSLAWRRSALCLGAIFLLACFLPEYLLGRTPNLFRTGVLLSLAFFVFVALVFLVFVEEEKQQALSQAQQMRAERAVGIFSVLYFGLTTYLALRKYAVFGYVGQDLAYFSQSFYTTLHGRFFSSNLLQDLLYSKPVTTDFASHNSPIMFIFVPFYYLRPSPTTIVVVRNFFMALCAWPAYLLAKQRFSPRLSALLAICFLLLPTILYQSLYDFYPLSLAVFFLLFTFYFYLQRRFLAFLGFCMLTLCVREDLVFAVFCFGLLAAWQRRDRTWALVPVLLSSLWAWLTWNVILPHNLHGGRFLVDACFAHLGANKAQMVRAILGHPETTLLTRNNLIYLKQFTTPFAGMLFIASPISLFSLPYLGINLLAGGGPCTTTLLFTQYQVVPTVILFVGFLITASRLSKFCGFCHLDRERQQAAVVFFVIALTVADLAFVTGKAQMNEFREQSWNAEAKRVAAMIPPDAAVAAPRYLLPLLANRLVLYQTHRLFDYFDPHPEYIIVDREWNRIVAADRWRKEYENLRTGLANNPSFQPIYESKEYVVYKTDSSGEALRRLGIEPSHYHYD